LVRLLHNNCRGIGLLIGVKSLSHNLTLHLLNPFTMPHPWIQFTALIYASFGILLGLYTFISPISAALLFGIDLASPPSNPATPPFTNNPAIHFVRVFGGRNLAIGLAVFAFYWQRMPRAIGTLLLCCTACGVVDTVVTGAWATRGSALVHAVGAGVMGAVGWGMM